jgi:hypothetical protein
MLIRVGKKAKWKSLGQVNVSIAKGKSKVLYIKVTSESTKHSKTYEVKVVCK